MRGTKLLASVTMAAAAIALAAPVYADPPPTAPYPTPRTPSPPSDYDAPFKNTVNGFGIYQPQDQLAWLGKITCDRIGRGVDTDPYKSANFIQRNLPRGTTEGQAFQFLGAAVDHYCPDQVGFVQSAGR
ncbi:hypothetical protein A5747_11600 [Mycobacterium sp. IS-836]|uniref:DUF732 domain-containing protein n=1 Tax=unclassified Mycobacterium TaxID=2642494 RepID=UPI00096F4C23|nr:MULTISPECIES: DUF732 domain-containing protein [unclassified Mycobacterium]OMC44354.1 hypothetical protein A5744_12245 [Mycobacterium sp. IS-1264]OMC46168.1 hypothetical protein A5745_11680 [Mycobacterium sp. IS-2888]OMC55766.1 hypothetical protein A5747_11600 [Mycobacterium sp. IS-836]